VTLFDLYPVLLLLGALGLVILWEVRHLVVARVVARRLATAAIGFVALLMVISLAVRLAAPGPLIPSSRLLNWQLNGGALGSSDPAAAQTTTVVTIEVEHPGCAPIDVGPWLADPIISYTPWSVTITMHMNDTADAANCASQQAPHQGPLPIVGGYLTGIFYPVQLSEPLGGRTLFDGSSFPPQARPYR
jgi:hypothetical protein